MHLPQQIEHAFGWRACPSVVVSPTGPDTCDTREAWWFAHRDWRSLRCDDWETHRVAVYVFTPEAFRYYLPSLLTLSAASPARRLEAVDALWLTLDRSPRPEYWDEFIVTRLLGLTEPEYAAILDCLLLLSNHASDSQAQSALGRAFDTVVLLQRETASGFARASAPSKNRVQHELEGRGNSPYTAQ